MFTTRQTPDGGMELTYSHYSIAEGIADIFPSCRSCDTPNSRISRVEMTSDLIHNIILADRKKLAEVLENAVIETVGNSSLTRNQDIALILNTPVGDAK